MALRCTTPASSKSSAIPCVKRWPGATCRHGLQAASCRAGCGPSTSGLQVSFRADPRGRHTVMELVTTDRPGLLGLVGGILTRQEIAVRTAKIATIGERAEDVFHLVDAGRKPLSESRRKKLLAALKKELEDG